VSLGTSRYQLAGAGIQTAALAFGGYTGTAATAVTEEYTDPSFATQTLTTST
jgi:hypothetical protein